MIDPVRRDDIGDEPGPPRVRLPGLFDSVIEILGGPAWLWRFLSGDSKDDDDAPGGDDVRGRGESG